MRQTLGPQGKVKMYFLVKKKVSYGWGVYVVGSVDVLGEWQIAHALKLNWNQDDYWSGFAQVRVASLSPHHVHPEHPPDPLRIYYKYAVAAFTDPSPQEMQWEEGELNRVLLVTGDEHNIIIQNIWNANKICLNLLVPRHVLKPDTQIYLAGGCNQLGNWRNRLKMEKNRIENLSEAQIGKAKQNIIIQDYEVYTVILSVERNLRCFNYYFIKRNGNEWQPDRVPQREFKIDRAQNKHPTCLHISTKTSNFQLLELSKFAQLYYSKITDQIYIGGCIETIDDVKQLKKRGINAIVYLAASEYVYAKSGPKNLIKMISQENKIEYYTLKIELQRERTLLQEAKEAVQLLVYILKTEQKIVYIYCSTGTLLSPLLTSLYLHIEGKFSLKKALEFVKQKHPISSIDSRIMMLANEISGERTFEREVKKEEESGKRERETTATISMTRQQNKIHNLERMSIINGHKQQERIKVQASKMMDQGEDQS